jgi:hypothetical protein
MPTIEDLIRSVEGQENDAKKRYERAIREIENILATAKREGRDTCTLDEDRRVDAAFIARDRAKTDVANATYRQGELREMRDQDARIDRQLRDVHPAPGTGKPAYDRVHRIGDESRIYRRDEDPRGKKFIADVINAHRGDYSAAQRLGRHIDEERVERGIGYMTRVAGDAGTGAFTGLVVPQYLTEMYAPKARAGRPFAENCNHHDLPEQGMTVNISQVTTGTSVALQATELATVAGVSIDDTLLTENVQTNAGFQDVSRQAIERGTLVEDVVLDDLFRSHATTLDSTLINQATTGLAPVSTGQAYVNATVDTTAVPTVWKEVIKGQNTVEGVLLNQATVDLVVMHNRRWNWLTAAVSAAWPVIAGTTTPPQSWGVQLTNEYGPKVRAVTASGLKICVDANVSTACLAQATTGGTQDQIYVVSSEECHLWEDPNAPMLIRSEAGRAKDLAVTLVVYSFFAYSLRRYAGGSVTIHGTGLAPPSFV